MGNRHTTQTGISFCAVDSKILETHLPPIIPVDPFNHYSNNPTIRGLAQRVSKYGVEIEAQSLKPNTESGRCVEPPRVFNVFAYHRRRGYCSEPPQPPGAEH